MALLRRNEVVALAGVDGGLCRTPWATRRFASFGRQPMNAEETLETAREAAIALGYSPFEVYQPWILVDTWQQCLLALHSTLGDGGLAVSVAAVLLRLATLPWNLRSIQKSCDRMELAPVYMDLAKALNLRQRKRGGTDPSEAAKTEMEIHHLSAAMKDMYDETKFTPLQGMGYQFLCLFPMYITGYFTLRGIVAHPDMFRGFVVEPTMWLDSLVLADPLGLLPAVSACAVLLNVELNSPPTRPGQEENSEYMKLVVRGAALTFAPVTTLLPSAILVFMATNATYTAAVMYIYKRHFWTAPEVKPQWLLANVLK